MQNHNKEKSEWIHVIFFKKKKKKECRIVWHDTLPFDAMEKSLTLNPNSCHEISPVSISFQFSFQQPPENLPEQAYQAEVIQEREEKTSERGQQVERNSGNTHFNTCRIQKKKK